MRTYCKVWTIQASYICEYEFADTKPADGEMTDKENFYWSNISDILKEVKETERAGKIPKKYNLQSEHFTFYETYYNAMKLMNKKKRGTFIKAICAYMFENEETKFENKTIQGYFNLCKRKMDLSKKEQPKNNGLHCIAGCPATTICRATATVSATKRCS